MGNELGEALPVVYVVRQTLVACGLIPPHFVGTHLLRVETINQQFCVIENQMSINLNCHLCLRFDVRSTSYLLHNPH